MNLLIVLPNDSLGGAEQYLKMLANYHKHDSIDVFFLKNLGGTHWSDLEKSVELRYLSQSSYFKGLLSLVSILLFKNEKFYDRVYSSHTFITAIIGSLISLGLIKKDIFVGRESTSIFERFKGLKLLFYKIAYKVGYRNLDLLICQTDFMKRQLVENFPSIQKRTRVVVLDNPIDVGLIKSQETGGFDFLPPQNFIVSAGRLIPEKGFDLLINAFASLKPDFSNVELVILGEGPERNALERLIEENNAELYVHLPGRVDNVYPYFKKASLCVVSSRIEGFPNVLLQMMSQNTTVVTTLCAGGMDKIPAIQKIPTNDEGKLANALRNGLTTDSAQNREVLDTYLMNRDISSFMTRLDALLNEKHA